MSIEVKQATYEDLPFINEGLKSSSVIRHINDDETIKKNIEVTDPTNFIMIVEDSTTVGFYLATPKNSVTVDIHTCARRCSDKGAAALLLEEYLKNKGVYTITSHVPDYNKAALQYALDAGCHICGYIPESYLFRSKLIGQYIVYKNIRG